MLTTMKRPPLTKRERQFLAAILAGCSNKEIAARHDVELQTVKNTLVRLYAKFGVTSRLALSARVRRSGLGGKRKSGHAASGPGFEGALKTNHERRTKSPIANHKSQIG